MRHASRPSLACVMVAAAMACVSPSLCHADMVVGTWNVRLLSAASRSGPERTLILDRLVGFDLVAVEEVMDDSIAAILADSLRGRGLDFAVAQTPAAGKPPNDERVAVFYRADRVQLGPIGAAPLPGFVRPPAVVPFTCGTFDGVLVAVHLVYGDQLADRQAEARQLPQVVQQLLDGPPDPMPGERDILLIGDFNLGPEDPSFAGLRSWMTPLFGPGAGTTIAGSDLDNIWLGPDTGEYTGECGVDRFDETVFGGDDRQASLAVSDHRPLWARFRTDTADDDGPPATAVGRAAWGQTKGGISAK